MHAFLVALIVAISLKIVLLLYRVVKGPTIFDRLTGLGVIGTDVLLILVFVGFVTDRVDMFVDISIAYAGLSFIGVLVLAKYYERKGDIDW